MTDSKVDASPATADQGIGADDPVIPEAVTSFQAITKQEDLDRIIQNRLAREQAKYADYDTLKEKAALHDQAEADKLSEIDKANKRAEKAETELAELRLEKLRRDVAEAKGLPAHLVPGTTRDEMESAADALLSWRGEVPAAPPNPTPSPRPVAQQGNPSTTDRPSGIAAGEDAARRRGWIK
ncbi:capsid assembly scaffolding protein Gp46 family protein [Nocardia arthritidis]|uniref:DUF4355 domain-containing protein n=1 Tax=Nocardia arthritidis TaxID=228602 RepID=A0A6G9YTR6_9NOCA|nr:DUF4355 domain-containing protein [Nocardia arthritidis]QIS16491.1 hypothetical protein F5544_43435 [Nocardia arthritidis]